MSSRPRPQVLLCDAQQLFASGLQRLLEPELAVVGVLRDAGDLLAVASTKRPDLVVCELSGPATRSLTTVQSLVTELPDLRVVVLSTRDDAIHVIGAFRAGARGYLLKSASPEELHTAVFEVLQGHYYASPAVTGYLVESLNGNPAAPGGRPEPTPAATAGSAPPATEHPLTEREEEVLRLVAHGQRNRDIADQLCISEATVRSHLSHLYDKLDLDNRVALALYALRNGLVRAGGLGHPSAPAS